MIALLSPIFGKEINSHSADHFDISMRSFDKTYRLHKKIFLVRLLKFPELHVCLEQFFEYKAHNTVRQIVF